MADKHIKQKLRMITLLMLLMGVQPMLIFRFFDRESAGWIAGFNFIALTIIVLYGLTTIKNSFRRSIALGIGFLVLCILILTGRAMEWDLSMFHQFSSAYYLFWLGIFIYESYVALKNKTRIDDPGL